MIRQRGFATYSLLEIIVVVCLILILAAVAADRLLPLRGAAEAARFSQILGSMRAGLGAVAVDRALHPSNGALETLAGSNPLRLLAAGPEYQSGPVLPDHGIEPGSWFYASGNGTLYYRVAYPQYFAGGFGTAPLIRMRIEMQDSSEDGVGRKTLQLVVLDHYHWLSVQPTGSPTTDMTKTPGR